MRKKGTKLKISEAENLRLIREFLEYKKWKVFRVNNAGTYNPKTKGYYFHGSAGVPDLIALKENQPILFLEIKSSIGRSSKAQEEFLDLVNETDGAIGVVVRRLGDVEQLLMNLEI